MECEDFARARTGVAPVREPRDLPRALVDKGQRFGVRDPFQLGVGVAFGLQLNCGESGSPAVRLGLDDTNGPSVGKEHVVGRTDVGLVLADRDADPGIEVDGAPVLHIPAGRPEAVVDPVPGDLFGVLVDVTRHGIGLVDLHNGRVGQLRRYLAQDLVVGDVRSPTAAHQPPPRQGSGLVVRRDAPRQLIIEWPASDIPHRPRQPSGVPSRSRVACKQVTCPEGCSIRCRKILFCAACCSKRCRKGSTSNLSRIASLCASVGRSSGAHATTIERYLCSNSSESATSPRLQPDRYAWTAVEHRERAGGVHVHVLAARCDLETGKRLNIAPPG